MILQKGRSPAAAPGFVNSGILPEWQRESDQVALNGCQCSMPASDFGPRRISAMPAATDQSLIARREDVVDTVHGVQIPDPYRWLEDGQSAETRAWTDAQNARTDEVLSRAPGRGALEARLNDLLRVGSVGSPVLRGNRVFFAQRTGDQSQPVMGIPLHCGG